MANYGTISLRETNPENASRLSRDAIAVLELNSKIERAYQQLAADAAQFGIARRTGENAESDVEFLKRVAEEATAAHHSLVMTEDIARVKLIAEGKAQPRRTGLAGLLSKASDRLASL